MFVRSGLVGRDVIRVRYLANGYDIQLSQTVSLFAIKLTPQNGQDTGTDDNGKLEAAKALCLRIFVKTGMRWNPQVGDPRDFPVNDLPQKIASCSFRKDTCLRMTGDESILIGRPRTKQEEGVQTATHVATYRTVHAGFRRRMHGHIGSGRSIGGTTDTAWE